MTFHAAGALCGLAHPGEVDRRVCVGARRLARAAVERLGAAGRLQGEHACCPRCDQEGVGNTARGDRDSACVEINLSCRSVSRYAGAMGLLEILIIILVLAAIFGGIAVSPLLFVLLIVVLVMLFTRGGFGYRRGSRG